MAKASRSKRKSRGKRGAYKSVMSGHRATTEGGLRKSDIVTQKRVLDDGTVVKSYKSRKKVERGKKVARTPGSWIHSVNLVRKRDGIQGMAFPKTGSAFYKNVMEIYDPTGKKRAASKKKKQSRKKR